MIRRAKRHGHVLLYSCRHHSQPEKRRTDIVMLEDCISIICHDSSLKKSWRQRVSICLVSALIQNYYYDLSSLWELLSRSIVFTGTDVAFSTQHIIHFRTKVNSQRVESYIIYEVFKALNTTLLGSMCSLHWFLLSKMCNNSIQSEVWIMKIGTLSSCRSAITPLRSSYQSESTPRIYTGDAKRFLTMGIYCEALNLMNIPNILAQICISNTAVGADALIRAVLPGPGRRSRWWQCRCQWRSHLARQRAKPYDER